MADQESGGMNAIVAIIAIIAILVIGYFAVQMMQNTNNDGDGTSINVDLPGTAGSTAGSDTNY